MPPSALPNTAESADRVHCETLRPEQRACSAALPQLAGEELLDAIVWDQAALDKFRRYFLPRDTAGPPTYQVDKAVVLGELYRLARREPLLFTDRPPCWVRGDPKAIGYATLGDWCAFAIGLRDQRRVDHDHEGSESYQRYAAISTLAPIRPGNDWRQIDVNSLSERVLAYAVRLTRAAAPAYARAAGVSKTASTGTVRRHFFDAVADHGRMVREKPSWAAEWRGSAEGFLMLGDRSAFAICRRDPSLTGLKRPYPFCTIAYLTPRA
jgi:hypothetical protein